MAKASKPEETAEEEGAFSAATSDEQMHTLSDETEGDDQTQTETSEIGPDQPVGEPDPEEVAVAEEVADTDQGHFVDPLGNITGTASPGRVESEKKLQGQHRRVQLVEEFDKALQTSS